MGYIIKIILNIFDSFTLQKIFKKIEFLIGKNFSILIDVGSHHGEYILSIKKKFIIKEVYGFEPNPTSFTKLKKKIYKIKDVFIYNYGISDIEKYQTLNQNIESSSSSMNLLNKDSKYYRKKYLLFNFLNLKNISNPIRIKTINLLNFINNKKLDKIDLLKIDTEGYEFKIIKGLGHSISKIKLIHLEHHFDDMIIKNYNLSDIHNYLISYNFVKVFKIKMKFRKSFEYIYLNKKF